MDSLEGMYGPDDKLPTDRDPLPAGNYNMEITEASRATTKAGDGEMLKYTVSVIDGEHEGRLIFGNFNTTNKNEIAERLGRQDFNALRKVIGVESPRHTSDLYHKSFVAVVKVKPPSKGKDGKEYGASNEIDWAKTLKLASGGVPPSKSAPVAAPVATNTAAAKRPWATT